ncbi:hypothetical protein HDU82_008464 [Entophlyctis luteolus]|nr:hypothetical protein HDU82_008464 [Entophlyctis luteolus]
MAPTITFTQRQRIGSIASIGSDDSSDSSAASAGSAADSEPALRSTPRAARSTSDSPVLVGHDGANSKPLQRRSYSMFEKQPKPILRTPSSIFRSGSDASGDEASAMPLKRISFSSESLLLFNNEEAPQAVAREPLFAKDINASPPSPIFPSDSDSSENLHSKGTQLVAPPLSWSILSTTSHLLMHPVALTPSSPIIFESVKIASSAYPVSNSPVLLRFHILVQNLHYEKAISVVYTSNSWKTNNASGLGRYDSSLGNGVDRFLLDVECDTSFSSNIVGSIDRIVSVEFAIKCVMGGVEYWDNRGGMNHLVMLKSEGSVSTPAYVKPPRKILSALDLESSQHLKRRASMLALKMGHAIADEARRIDDEFKHGLKKQNDSAASTPRTSFSESDSSISQNELEMSTNATAMSRSQHRPEPSKPREITAATSSATDSQTIRHTGSFGNLSQIVRPKAVKASSSLLNSNDRVTELSERESEYVNIISRPNSPLVDVRPLRRVGSNSSLSVSEVSVGAIVRSSSPLVNGVGGTSSAAGTSSTQVEGTSSVSEIVSMASPVPISLKGPHTRFAVLNTPSKLGVRLDKGDDYAPLSNPLYSSGEHYGSLYSRLGSSPRNGNVY